MTSADKGKPPTPGEVTSPAPVRTFDWDDPLTRFGAYVSGIWTVVSVIALCAFADWSKALSPNEWGDLAAGFAAPLAFFWLVLGFLQQGKELRLSTNALMLQVEELKNTVKHQADLVQVTREQVQVQLRQDENSRRAQRLAIRPSFVIKSLRRASGSSGFSYDISLSNVGATVTKVRVEFLGTRFFPAIAIGDEEQFRVRTPVGQKDPIDGTIHFTDREGDPGSIGFVATIDASQDMQFAMDAVSISP